MDKGLVLKHCKNCLIMLGMILLSPAAICADYPKEVDDLIADAYKFYNQGKYSSARIQFNKVLRHEPNCPEAYNGLGLCAAKEGRLQESNGCYLNALKLEPDYYDSLYNLANNNYMAENYAEAISNFSRALQVHKKKQLPLDADLLIAFASVYRNRSLKLSGLERKQDMKCALELYHKAIGVNPSNPQAHAKLGQLYFDFDKYSVAEYELRRAISLKTDYAFAYFILGQLYVKKKECPAALVAFHNSLKFETVPAYKDQTAKQMMDLGIPSSVVDHFALGFEELNSSQWELAQTEFEAATALTNVPLKAVALNNLGYAYTRAGNLPLSITKYKQALTLSPHGLPELYYNLGTAYFQEKNLAAAEQAFKQCLKEAKGNHYLAHNALGIVLKEKGKLNESLNQYNLALLQSGGELSVIQFNRGLLLEKLGRKTEAAECYEKYLQDSPSGLNAPAARDKLSLVKLGK